MLPTLRVAGILFILSGTIACSTTPEDSQPPSFSSSTQPVESSQQDLAAATREYSHHAAELREMARRRQIEADVLAQKDNPDMEKVQAKRDLAKDLLEAAEQSEAKARELRRRVPHGMVQ
ncbi:MAG TPA: hypothetical protein VJ805_14800 [Nitrospiraceae bacterium]|nr:hypothetical protein [Nitrospiraceae bacterium]